MNSSGHLVGIMGCISLAAEVADHPGQKTVQSISIPLRQAIACERLQIVVD